MRVEWSVSIRRACAAILLDPKTYRFKSRRPGQAAVRTAFQYLDAVYLAELDLFRAEGITARDVASCTLPEALPRNIFVVDEGEPVFSVLEAMEAMGPGSRMMMLSLDSDQRLYR